MAIYAGLDVHKRNCHGVIMDEDGEVLEDGEFENSPSFEPSLPLGLFLIFL